MPIAPASYQCGDEHVTIIKLVFFWRKHVALLFDLMDVYEQDRVMLISKIYWD